MTMRLFDILVSQNTLIEVSNGPLYSVVHTIKDDGYELTLEYGTGLKEEVIIPYENIKTAKRMADGSINLVDVDGDVVNLRLYNFTDILDFKEKE